MMCTYIALKVLPVWQVWSYAICIIQEEELKESNLKQGGILTPASAMGMVLVPRLERAGVSFSIQ